MAGFRYINGFPNQAPVRPNISLGDSVSGLTAALGVVMSLLARNKLSSSSNLITGQVVDVAIYESMFNMMEGILSEYDRFGEVNLIELQLLLKNSFLLNDLLFTLDKTTIWYNCYRYCTNKCISMFRSEICHNWR